MNIRYKIFNIELMAIALALEQALSRYFLKSIYILLNAQNAINYLKITKLSTKQTLVIRAYKMVLYFASNSYLIIIQ